MERLEGRFATKVILGVKREVFMFINKPCVVDEFIPAEDKMNILLQVEITDEECNHSRAGLRIRRKLSPIFTDNYDYIVCDYSIMHMFDGKHFLRAEYHCHSRTAGKELYNELVKAFFKNV